MTSTYRILLCVAAVVACLGPGRALAADAGRTDAGTLPITRDAGVTAGDAGPKVVTIDDSPLACNGALCATSTGATFCSIAGVGRASAALSISGALCAAAAVSAFSRRARRAGEPRR